MASIATNITAKELKNTSYILHRFTVSLLKIIINPLEDAVLLKVVFLNQSGIKTESKREHRFIFNNPNVYKFSSFLRS